MTKAPKISIIMPAFCAADTLTDAIKSVQAQTLQNWELIIVDDGSTDDTAAVAKSLQENDTRISLIQQENAGPSAARNHGVSQARADTLAFLDADDFWAPQRLHGMLAMLDSHPQIGVLFSRTRFFDGETRMQGRLTPHTSALGPCDLMAENAVCSTSNIVCRRAVFEQTGGFAEGLHYAEDQDWLLRVALADRWRITGVDAEWFFYRSDKESQSADLEAMRTGWLQLVQRAKADFPVKANQAARDAFGPLHRQLARRALRLGRPRDALRYLVMALAHDPTLLLRQPRRTALTLLGAVLILIPNQKLKELVAK